MAAARTLRLWTWVHKWSSLVCTAFMLLLCLTGLPLIFHQEIDHLLGNDVQVVDMPPGTPHASLDRILQAAQALYPQRVVQFASQPEGDERLWFVTLTPTPAPTDDFKSIAVDARTAAILPQRAADEGFMHIMFKLHVDLFAGMPGKLFLGLMGVLLLLAIVSGVVLYAPFMRKLDFGTVRHQHSTRTRWLDLHNLLGIATLVWALVVGATGVINTWAELVIDHWQSDQMATLLKPYQGLSMVASVERASVQKTLEAALAQVPGTKLSFMAFPGTSFSTPRHDTFFLRGNTPLTARVLQPVMVDASTARVSAALALPWYVSALLLSQPLHFGDYGGLPMKCIWALLDIATIVVLGSGLYLWLSRRKPRTGKAVVQAPASPSAGAA